MTREKEMILARPNLASQLPYRFENGLDISDVIIDCGGCGRDLNQEHLRGELAVANVSTVSFDGHGVCPSCGFVAAVSARFNDTGEFLCRDGGEWKRGVFQLPSGAMKRLFERMSSWYRQMKTAKAARSSRT